MEIKPTALGPIAMFFCLFENQSAEDGDNKHNQPSHKILKYKWETAKD